MKTKDYDDSCMLINALFSGTLERRVQNRKTATHTFPSNRRHPPHPHRQAKPCMNKTRWSPDVIRSVLSGPSISAGVERGRGGLRGAQGEPSVPHKEWLMKTAV